MSLCRKGTAGVNASQGQLWHLTWLSPQRLSLGDARKGLYFNQLLSWVGFAAYR